MIIIDGLKKELGKKQVLNGLNLSIGDGELFGFIGPNGAGKTTTMRILAGLLVPDAGEITINGLSLQNQMQKIKMQIGYMPDFFGIYDNLTVLEYMEFFADIYEVPVREQKTRIPELLELVDLLHETTSPVDSLSRGMKQKLCLARTLVHRPSILLLDEPGSGMEPAARVEMKQILQSLSSHGTTIVISSHILSELSELCTDIGIIESGRIILRGNKDEVMRQANGNSMMEITVLQGMDEAIQLLKSTEMVKNISKDKNIISVHVEGDQREETQVLSSLVQNGVLISSYKKSEGSLENLFLKLTKG